MFSVPSSKSYKINHNLSENNYGGIRPFNIQANSTHKVEECKVGDIIDPLIGIKEESKPYLGGFSNNIEEIEGNGDNLFNLRDSAVLANDFSPHINPFEGELKQPSEEITLTQTDKHIKFLHNLSSYK